MDDEVHIPELLAVLSPERYYRRSTFAPVQSHGDCHAHTFGAYPDRKPRFTVGFDRDVRRSVFVAQELFEHSFLIGHVEQFTGFVALQAEGGEQVRQRLYKGPQNPQTDGLTLVFRQELPHLVPEVYLIVPHSDLVDVRVSVFPSAAYSKYPAASSANTSTGAKSAPALVLCSSLTTFTVTTPSACMTASTSRWA